MTLVLPDNSPDQIQVLYQSLRLSEDTVAASLAAQAEATSLRNLSPIEAQVLVVLEAVANLVGQPVPQLLSTVTAMLLTAGTDRTQGTCASGFGADRSPSMRRV